MIELMEQLYELAEQPHANCSFDDRYNICQKEHLILARARKMLAEMKKY